MKRLILKSTIWFCFIAVALNMHAQEETFFSRSANAYDEFFKKTRSKYDNFNREVNLRYAEFMRKSWKKYSVIAGIPVPEDDIKPVSPIEYTPTPVKDDVAPIEDKFIPIKEESISKIPIISPGPQPSPPKPIETKPIVLVENHNFVWNGTCLRTSKIKPFKIKSGGETELAKAWEFLSSGDYDNLILESLKLRDDYNLCDWAYLSMLMSMCESLCGKDSNEATLLCAYIYSNSGYSMRLAFEVERLVLMYSSKHTIYKQPYFTLNGNDKFYAYNSDASTLKICEASFPNEQKMSLYIPKLPKLGFSNSDVRKISSERYPQMFVNVVVNKNLMDFFNSYPTSEVNGDFMTRWAIYATTPLGEEVIESIYPSFRNILKGKNQLSSANMLLNWVQTGLVYEYDDKVWGCDRAFFGDESLYYPYCDCEDRSILFSHLIRDLLNLDVALIYYPGHLATAVAFTDDVNGDYVIIEGKKFVICDPTYINAPVGKTMPSMNNNEAKVIIL